MHKTFFQSLKSIIFNQWMYVAKFMLIYIYPATFWIWNKRISTSYIYIYQIYIICVLYLLYFICLNGFGVSVYIYIYIYLCMYFYIFINGDLSELMSEVFVIIYMVMDIMAISEYIYQSGHYHLKIINVIWFI